MNRFEGLKLLVIISFITTLVFQTWGKISITDWIIILSITLACTGISFTISSLLGLYDER